MKFLSLVLALALPVVAAAQGAIKAPAPNPFAPKGNPQIKDAPITGRGVLVFAGQATPYTASHDYHIFVGDNGYHVQGIGPKTAGIYDVAVTDKTIIVHEYHPGGASIDIKYTLTIVSPYHHEPAPAEYTMNVVDGRRLLVYEVTGVQDSLKPITYKALAVDNATGKETRFEAVTYGLPPLTRGIYDFLITTDSKDYDILNVYVPTLNTAEVFTVYPLRIPKTK